MSEPYFEYIQADSLTECDIKAYKISCRSGLSQGNYDIFRLMEEADYAAEPNFYIEEE
jgi:hypothetical protein